MDRCAGAYQIDTKGMRVALVPAEITQQDFLFQGVRDGQALFWGALGAKQAYVVANEQRYATVGVNRRQRFALNVPDKELELFQGKLGGKT